MSCKIFRNSEGKVETVIAPNGQESRLYNDILNLPEVQGDEALAVDLYLTAYTPSFKNYFGDFELGSQKGLVDQNNEPFASALLNFLKPPPAVSKFVRKTKDEEEEKESTPVPVIRSIANVKKVLDRLKDKFGVDYEIVYEPNTDWKGKYENGKVYINGSKGITKDTAFHEYLHPFMMALKKDNKPLYDRLIALLQSVEEGRMEIEGVSKSEGYENLTDEEKLDEALVSYIGKLASGNITEEGDVVESEVQRVRQSLLAQVKNWLKRLFQKLFSIRVTDLELTYNLQDIADFVSLNDIKVDLAGIPTSSTPRYQLDEKTREFKNFILRKANDLQQKVIQDLLFEPKPGEAYAGKVILEPENHVYIHTKTGQTYKSVTTAIKGVLEDPENLYELNRLFGNEFDKTLQSIIEGKSFEEARADMTGILSEEISRSAYNTLKGIFVGLTADGSIILPQIILADPDSGIAGSLDIFIVSPEGKVKIYDLKVSKNSFRSDKYKNTPYDVKKESIFEGQTFTTRQQHGLQVSAYRRLAEVNGYQVDQVSTIHILLDIEGKAQDQKIKSFEVEGIQDHEPSLYERDVNKMIKTKSSRNKVNGFKKELGLHNPANDEKFLDENEQLPENDVSPELMEQVGIVLDKYVDKLTQRQEYLKKLNKTRFSTFSESSKEEVVDRISLLLSTIEEKRLSEPSAAFTELLKYTKETLDNIYRYINDPANIGKPEYIDVILEAEKYVESYREIASIPELGLGSETQYKLMRSVQSRLNAVKEEINPALEAYVKDLIKKKTNASSLSEEELDKLLREGYDISLDQYGLSDMQNTKERLLAIAANLYTEANQKAMNRADEFIKKISDAGNALAAALGMKKIDFSFMLNYTKDGKFTGRYLEAIGEKYYEMRKKVYALVKNDKGENLEYVFIPDVTKAKPEDVLFNIDLQRKKEKLKEFLQAERLVNGKIESGEYHRYSTEFLNERAKYEQPDMDALDYGILKWKQKTGVSNSAYRKFRDKYYDRREGYVGVKFESDGSYKGKTEVKPPTYFVKKEYVETKEISSTGEDMRDPRYAKLMNPKTAVERAQKEFYLVFIEEMKDTLEKLPIDVQQKMVGKVARVADNYIDAAKRKGSGTFKAITKNVREWFDFSPKLHTNQRLTDDDGYPTDNLPILYTNNARNEKAIESLKEKIKELKDEYIVKKSITTEVYEDRLKKLQMSLAIENSKIEYDDINVDLVQNIIAFRKMAEKYEQMSNIESSLLALSKIVEKKKYYETNSLGEKFKRKGKDSQKDIYKKEGASLAHERFKKWFKMVYYNNDEYDYSTFAMVADKIQNITSIKGMGLNIFGSINNYVMGRINNAIEAYGGVYFQRKAYFRATGEFNRDYIPGFMKKIGSDDGGPYKIKKPKSKYEAMVDYFRIVRKFQSDAGRVDMLGALYVFQESGEYNVQSKTGVAITMSDKFMLTNSKTGEKVAIYDAFDFNENTQELTLKPGFEISEDYKTKVTNYIYEVNKQIHGNYAWEDRMVIQQHALGELGAQFHKWVYPLIRARFQKRYDNEVLGTIEGRYRTFWNVMKYVYQTEQGVLGKLTGMFKATFAPGSVKGLDEIQVRNMYKNIAEISFFFASFLMAHLFKLLASGLDDDDEEVKKLVNFLIFQQTRQMNEIKTFIPALGIKEQFQMAKNPIAALSTMRDFGEVAASVLTMPFPPYDKNYYERGPFKGELKAWKEARDVIPALNVLNRWESFQTVRNFYIR